MATLTAKLVLTSSDTGTAALDATTSSALTVTTPLVDIARTSIATGSAQALIASNSALSYAYIKNVSGTGSDPYVIVQIATVSTLKLRVGEFAFIPLQASKAIGAEAYVGACTVEYGYWSV